tara:strand:- start:356 stop:2503 length:2148 start_codon:yes stop_codon:yes gene_type:complete
MLLETKIQIINIMKFSIIYKNIYALISSFFIVSYFFLATSFHGKEVALTLGLVFLSILVIYYFFITFFREKLVSIFWVLISFLILSLVNVNQKIIFIILILSALAFIIYKRKYLLGVIALDLKRFQDIGPFNIFIWGLLFNILLFNAIYSQNGFVAIDPFHPIYEHSMGLGYEESILNPPDLSYIDSSTRYHFFTTRLASLWTEIFDINILNSIYIVNPFFLTVILFVAINIIFSNLKYLKTPAIVLFFFPLTLLKSTTIINVFRYSILQSTSFYVATILIIFAAYFLYYKKFGLLIFTGAVLVISKASFFLVLLGATIIYLLKIKSYKTVYILSSIMFIIFLSLYFIFLSGAHPHNHWIIFPNDIFYFLFRNDKYSLISLFVNLIIALLFFKVQNKQISLVLSFCFSGVLWYFFLSEIEDRNSIQFIKSFSIFYPILIWYFFDIAYQKFNNVFRSLMLPLLLLPLSYSIYQTIKFPINVYFNHKKIERGENEFYRLNDSNKKIQFGFSRNFIHSYQSLKSKNFDNSLILIGKQYEDRFNSKVYWPSDGFVRSAMSGRQLYTENYKKKSVGMHKDFPMRFAKSIHFYKSFVLLSEQSKQRLDVFYLPTFGLIDGEPHSRFKEINQKSAFLRRAKYYLGFKKEWSWSNRRYQIDFETRKLLKDFDSSEEWALNFLKSEGISHIVLEMYDRPNSFLQNISKEVYKSEDITILQIDAL